MKRTLVRLVACFFIASAWLLAGAPADGRSRRQLPIESGWRFSLGDPPEAEKVSFDDAKWRTLDVPHDWSIEGAFDEKNPTGGAGAFLPAGVGWYRKHFTLSLDHSRRRVFIDFDGVMANSDVWINGFHLGRRPYGYASFRYELTGHLNFGKGSNVIAVRADNSGQPASRWYSGAGIYRHVRMVFTDSVHIDQWGTFVTTPRVSADNATVLVHSKVVNQSELGREVFLEITVVGPDGRAMQSVKTKPQTVSSMGSTDFTQNIPVKKPKRWDLEHPVMYKALVRVLAAGRILDEESTSFGIREFRFEAATGFWLNGRNFKIKGVCLHHDGSAFGGRSHCAPGSGGLRF